MWFRYKQHSLIPLLLSRSAKVTDVDTRTGSTALHYVLQYPGVTSRSPQLFTVHFLCLSSVVVSLSFVCPYVLLIVFKR